MKRFINTDSYVSTGQGLLSSNMFVYCLNNPVNLADPTGDIAIEAVIGGINGAVLCMLLAAATTYTVDEDVTRRAAAEAVETKENKKYLTYVEEVERVAMGLDVMCLHQGAAIAIAKLYPYNVGPENHGAGKQGVYYDHYHPNRHSHTHIWYLGPTIYNG